MLTCFLWHQLSIFIKKLLLFSIFLEILCEFFNHYSYKNMHKNKIKKLI